MTNWAHAACNGADLSLFYPLGHTSRDDQVSITEAKTFCARCPIWHDCLESADGWGIWAGLTETERETPSDHRKRLKRNQNEVQRKRALGVPERRPATPGTKYAKSLQAKAVPQMGRAAWR